MQRFYSYTKAEFLSDLSLHKPTLQYIDDRFHCLDCQHSFELASCLDIFKYRGNTGCPNCNPGAFKQSDFESYVNLLKEKGLESSKPIFKLDSNSYEFKCSQGHNFVMKPRNVLALAECPECKKIRLFHTLFDPLVNNQLTIKVPPENWNKHKSFEVSCKCCGHSRSTNIKALQHMVNSGRSVCGKCNQETRLSELYSAKLSNIHLNSSLTILNAKEFTSLDSLLSCSCSRCNVTGNWTVAHFQSVSEGCPACNRLSFPVRTESDATYRILSLFPDAKLEVISMVFQESNLAFSIFNIKHECGYSQEYTYHRLLNMKGVFKCPGCSPVNSNKYSAASLILNRHLKAQYSDLIYQDKQELLKEWMIRCDTSKYYLDAYSPSANAVIEFHGDRFHGNPKLYEPDYVCHPFTGQLAKELYNATCIKEQFIRNSGYSLATIWESDYWNMSWTEIDEYLLEQLKQPLTLGEFFVYGRGYWKSYEGDRSLTIASFTDPEIPSGVAYKPGQSLELASWIYPSTSPEIVAIDPLDIEIHESSDKVTSFWHWDEAESDYFLYFVRTKVLNSLLHIKMVVRPMEDVEYV